MQTEVLSSVSDYKIAVIYLTDNRGVLNDLCSDVSHCALRHEFNINEPIKFVQQDSYNRITY